VLGFEPPGVPQLELRTTATADASSGQAE
jgi:hypothetical protein